jgi:hypothetical protein
MQGQEAQLQAVIVRGKEENQKLKYQEMGLQ